MVVQLLQHTEIVSIDVAHYMFCHPEHVQHRKGMPPLFRWQHLMAASGTELVVKLIAGHWNLVQVSSSGEQLERIEFEDGLELIVTVLDDWIAFRWTIDHLVSQFQVRSNDLESIEELAKKLERASIYVTWKPSFRDHIEAPPIDTTRLSFWDQIDNQMTQVEPHNGKADVAPIGKFTAQVEPTRIEMQSTQEEATQVELTQVDIRQAEYQSTQQQQQQQQQQHCYSLNGEDDTRSEVCSDISRISSCNHSISRLSVPGSEVPSSIFSRAASIRQRHPAINLKKGTTLSLPITSLSYAMKAEAPEGLVRWKHLGLVSGLELNMIPSDKDGEPLISIMRALSTLEAFVPDTRYIKVFASNELLVFQQSGIANIQKERYIQLELEPSHIETICAWLKLWNIHVFDPEEPPETTVTMTIDTNFRHETSSTSRESRWWARQRISELPRTQN